MAPTSAPTPAPISRRAFVRGAAGLALGGCKPATVRTPPDEIARFPLIDNHSHYMPKSLTRTYGMTPQDMIDAMDAAGIRRTILVGFGDEVPELPKRYPGRFAAAYVNHNFRWRQDPRYHRLIPPDQRIVKGMTQAEVDNIGGEFEDALATGLYNAVAEITTISLPLRQGAEGREPFPGSTVPPDSPLVLRLMELAARHDIPINVHCESTATDAMVRAVSRRRATRVIWAHTGSYLAPDAIAALLADHPNLDFDLSAKNPLYQARSGSFLTFGTLEDNWRRLFEAYPDRFYFGVDFVIASQLHEAPLIGEYARALFSQLTPGTAAKIGYENALRSYRLTA